MKISKKILLIITGFFVSYYSYSLIYEIIDSNSCAIHQNGREILSRHNQIWIFILSMSLFHFSQLLIGFVFYKIKKFKQVGLGFFISFVLLFSYSAIRIFPNIDKQDRIVRFNQKEWKSLQEKPITMVRDIYLNWGHCHTKDEIITLLGIPDFPDGIKMYDKNYDWNSANNIYYLTDIKSNGYKSYLEFRFVIEDDSSNFKECNSVDLVTFGDNSQYSFNKYIELY